MAWVRALLGSMLLLGLPLLVVGCSKGSWTTSGLLAEATLHDSQHVAHVERLTDGVASVVGDSWRTEHAARLNTNSVVIWDLGESKTISAVWINGDNNDQFLIEGSSDGQTYREIWLAPKVRAAGMRDRLKDDLSARARYVRLSSRSSDDKISASEIMLFDEQPKLWPPVPKRMEGGADAKRMEFWLWMLGLTSAALVLVFDRRLPRSVLALSAVPALIFVGLIALFAEASWLPTDDQLHLSRAIAALIAVAVALRKSRWLASTARSRPVTGMLGFAALLSVLAFYNWATPQFPDYRVPDGRTYVHTWDMRVYFPQAKYFEELGFDGLYLASALAYIENAGVNESRIAGTELRDLRDYRLVRAGKIMDEIRAVKQRFSPERWNEFKRDMDWFRNTMGSAYLRSMVDHGGNATPVWLSLARLMFEHAPASELTMLLSGLIDPVLLLLLFIAIGRSYDWPTALSCLVVFGATTVTFLGSNWGGSTLRHDWMIATGLAVCAFKVGRPAFAGVLLAYATLIRVIPALPAVAILLPVVWWVIERWRERGAFPGFGALVKTHRATWRCMGGALICTACLVGASTAGLGFEQGWGKWAEKISLHTDKHTPNRVGLKVLFSFAPGQHRATERDPEHPAWTPWMVAQYRTFQSRRGWFWLASAALAALAFAAARRRGTDTAILIGTMLIPMLVYVSNYYHHIVFLLPMLASERVRRQNSPLWLIIQLALLGFCLHNFWSIHTNLNYVRFLRESWALVVCYIAIWSAMARDWPAEFGAWLNDVLAPRLPHWLVGERRENGSVSG